MNLLTQYSQDIQAIMESPGFFEDVLLISGDAVYLLRGRFVLNDAPVNPGSVASVAACQPVVSLRAHEVAEVLGRSLTRADKFRIHGQLYAVQEPRAHGQGWLNIRLKKLGNPAPGGNIP